MGKNTIIVISIILFIIMLVLTIGSSIINKRITGMNAFIKNKEKINSRRLSKMKKVKDTKIKTDQDLEDIGIDSKKLKEDEELLASTVDEQNDKYGKNAKDIIKGIFRDLIVDKAIDEALSSAERTMKAMRSNAKMQTVLNESNFVLKEGLSELDSIDFSKIPEGPQKKKLIGLIEESKDISKQLLENSTYDKLLGTSDMILDDVPSSEDLSTTNTSSNVQNATKPPELIDQTAGNKAVYNLQELSEKLNKNFDELNRMKSFMSSHNIKLQKFKRNRIVYSVNTAIDSVKHFTDTKLLAYVRRIKQMSGFTKRPAKEVAKELSAIQSKGAKFIANAMNSSFGKGLKNISSATKRGSKTISKKLGAEVVSEAGGVGIGMMVAMGIEVFSQMIETGSINGEQLKEVLKEEAIATAIEVGIIGTVAAGVAVASGTTFSAAFASTAAGPVGLVLAAASIAGAALDMSPAGRKFSTVMLSKDLNQMKIDYDDVYYNYYRFNLRGHQRELVDNWVNKKDIVVEGNFLDLDEWSQMKDSAVLEYNGYEAEYFEKNNLIHGPDNLEIMLNVKKTIMSRQLDEMKKEEQSRKSEEKRTLFRNYVYRESIENLSKMLIIKDIKHVIQIHKAKINTLRAKGEAIRNGSYNSSQRILLTLALKKLGLNKTTIKQLVLPQYGD